MAPLEKTIRDLGAIEDIASATGRDVAEVCALLAQSFAGAGMALDDDEVSSCADDSVSDEEEAPLALVAASRAPRARPSALAE